VVDDWWDGTVLNKFSFRDAVAITVIMVVVPIRVVWIRTAGRMWDTLMSHPY